MATVQRRLSVIVCADVVGYSRLMGADEVGTLTALKAHREAIDPLFAEEGGRLVKTTGDGLLLEFPSAFHAVRAGLAVQRLMAERNTDVSPDKRLVFRMGIHLGDVIVDADDIFGDGVNIAARLETLAEPGGMCISQAVHATIHKNIDAQFRDGGERALKNIAAPVHVYNLVLDGSAAGPMSASASSGPPLSLIVLPFTNFSGDSRHDALVDNITEQLTNELGQIDDSLVVNRKTALAYRGDSLDVTEIGRELGVRYVVRGNVRAAAGALRVNTQLIDTESGQPLWVDRFDAAIGDASTMQREVIGRLFPLLYTNLLAAAGRPPQPAPALQSAGGAEALAHPRGGTVVYPRGAAAPANVRAAQPAPQASPPAARSTVSPSSAIEPAARRPPREVSSSTRQSARKRQSSRVPFLVKLVVVAAAGGAAVALLGAEKRSIVEIVSWMLIAAGGIQMADVLSAGGRA
jgi:class 3 adenylate cyclase/TolB-like protein